MTFTRSLALAACLIGGGIEASAQGGGIITGTVRDTGGGIVAGARVEITGEGYTVTDREGRYTLVVMRAGEFDVRASFFGLGFATVPQVLTAPGRRSEVDFLIGIHTDRYFFEWNPPILPINPYVSVWHFRSSPDVTIRW